MKQANKDRRAAEQAEYAASLERAKQASAEQRAKPAKCWPMLGLVGLALDATRKPAIPPRPDQ